MSTHPHMGLTGTYTSTTTRVHTHTQPHTCTGTHRHVRASHARTYKCLHADACTMCMHGDTLTHIHTCTHNMHARHTLPTLVHVHARGTHTDRRSPHKADTHNTLLRTSEEEEEEEGRHIILFPLVQMTSLLGTNFCFDVFCYFIRSQRHGTGTKPRGFTDG